MLIVARQTIDLSQSVNFKKDAVDKVGDLSGVEIMFPDAVLVATYIQPEKTPGGIYKTNRSVEEDTYQGKVGLVLKMGDGAYADEDKFYGKTARVGDYVVYRPSDGWDVTIRGVPCRLIRDESIKMKIVDPELIT